MWDVPARVQSALSSHPTGEEGNRSEQRAEMQHLLSLDSKLPVCVAKAAVFPPKLGDF